MVLVRRRVARAWCAYLIPFSPQGRFPNSAHPLSPAVCEQFPSTPRFSFAACADGGASGKEGGRWQGWTAAASRRFASPCWARSERGEAMSRSTSARPSSGSCSPSCSPRAGGRWPSASSSTSCGTRAPRPAPSTSSTAPSACCAGCWNPVCRRGRPVGGCSARRAATSWRSTSCRSTCWASARWPPRRDGWPPRARTPPPCRGSPRRSRCGTAGARTGWTSVRAPPCCSPGSTRNGSRSPGRPPSPRGTPGWPRTCCPRCARSPTRPGSTRRCRPRSCCCSPPRATRPRRWGSTRPCARTCPASWASVRDRSCGRPSSGCWPSRPRPSRPRRGCAGTRSGRVSGPRNCPRTCPRSPVAGPCWPGWTRCCPPTAPRPAPP